MERMLFEFVDAGDDKEAADRKIQGETIGALPAGKYADVLPANFQLHWQMPQCRSIVLGGSGDRGYGGFLREYTQSQEDRSRIVLLQGQPFTRELAEVAKRVSVITAPELVRQTPLLPEGVATATSPAIRKDSPPYSYARAHYTANGSFSSTATPTVPNPAPTDASPMRGFSLNSKGQRIDTPVTPDKQVLDKFYKMEIKPCNDYHLNGDCWRSRCGYQHEPKLSSTELETLLYKTRGLPCMYTNCDDASCYYGHRCPYDGHCNRTCKFPDDMHNVDTNVVA